MKLLRETIKKLLKENAEEQMYIEKLNAMLDEYNKQESNWRSSDYQLDDSIYNQAIELATTLGLEEHPDLKVWGAMNGDTGDIMAMGLTEEEALSLTEWEGYPIRTDGERYGYDFLYYDV
tara:strand:+ start:1481 stop:1840 length:360 start_codon:yes stop_codon:yes gene_type:complete